MLHLILIEPISLGTAAHETSKCVRASAILTNTLQLGTFIDVLEDDGVLIGLESVSARADQLVLRTAHRRTQLTGRSPGSSHGTTTG